MSVAEGDPRETIRATGCWRRLGSVSICPFLMYSSRRRRSW